MLEVVGLHKTYGDVRAMDGVTLTVGRGRMLGFLGPNGSGKTTTMRAVFGLVLPQSGEVRWDGEPITSVRRKRFGYMPEQRGLYPRMQVADHLRYIAKLHGLTRREAATASDRWLERFGLDDRGGDRVEALSHGNQQRIQLAAALVHDPDLLVLDEPFSGLDPNGVDEMTEILLEQTNRGVAVLFSSHQLELVEGICEDVAIIRDGRIVLHGDVDDLTEASPWRRVELGGDLSDEWVASLPGVHAATRRRGRFDLLVDRELEADELLRQARAQGTVRHFAYRPPSLQDLFRESVR
ncbi:MAG: ATP-binding cassette domain-containing protein [Acidimicrobiia bacterium]|nr:ATP-binding cassette domain-containing protein [Acidimicrobiia bacterium]